MLCTGKNFFDCSETECGTNVTMWVKDVYIELNYGCGSVSCRPEGDHITPIEEGLDQMVITVSSRDENNPVNMNGNSQFSRVMSKPTMWFSNRSDINRAVQTPTIVRSLKFSI